MYENLTTFCFLARGNDAVFSTSHLLESLPSCVTASFLNYLLYNHTLGVQILLGIIRITSGMNVLDFANEYLFSYEHPCHHT